MQYRVIKFILLILTITTCLFSSSSSNIDVRLILNSIDHDVVTIKIINNSNYTFELSEFTTLDDELSENIFEITKEKEPIKYIGRLVHSNILAENHYMLLGPKEEIKKSIKLSKYYMLQENTNYKVKCNIHFKLNKIGEKKRYFLLRSNNVDISYMPYLKKEKLRINNAKFDGCTQNQEDILTSAYDKAHNIATEAYTILGSAPVRTWGDRYNVWFGEAYAVRQEIVTSNFEKIKNALPNIKYNCSSCEDPYIYSYVYPSNPYVIYLCNSFWDLPTINGSKTKAGILIHDVSRFDNVADADIDTSGNIATQNLAIYYPNKTATNASSYEYFAMNTLNLSMKSIFDNFNIVDNVIEDFPLVDSISFSTEKDIYKFTVNQSGLYTFYTTGDYDTVGMLLNSKFYKITKNDDTSDMNLNFKITHDLKIGETYYLKVSGYAPNIGAYVLKSNIENKKFSPIIVGDGLNIITPL